MGIRNIIFRGKTKQGDWVYGLLGCNYFRPNEKYYHIHNCETDDIQYEVIPETVGQFTGLTDKNGKKIFEGDIVELYDKNADVKWKAVIVFGNPYSNYSWGWELLYIGQNPKINTNILCWVEMEETGAYCEVIGNIYDNKELLGENK